MNFELHPNLANKSFIADLPLSRVLLEDEVYYPWIILVPRLLHLSRMMDLTIQNQVQLLKELDLAQKILWQAFQPTQLNVAAIGNKTPQLHIHVIARKESDPAWPHTVWDHPLRKPYSPKNKASILEDLREAFLKTQFFI
ncbi:HIT hydrolase [Chlamydiales bacterium STE3]|nr:HIT hydrolase [Chlamydiales bacterium STE3]